MGHCGVAKGLRSPIPAHLGKVGVALPLRMRHDILQRVVSTAVGSGQSTRGQGTSAPDNA